MGATGTVVQPHRILLWFPDSHGSLTVDRVVPRAEQRHGEGSDVRGGRYAMATSWTNGNEEDNSVQHLACVLGERA